MIEAQADIALGEAIRPAAVAHARIYSGSRGALLLPALAFAGAILLSTVAGMVLPLISLRLEGLVPSLWMVGGFLGLVAAFRILSRTHLRRFLERLRKIGSPAVFPTRFLFDEWGIRTESERLSHSAPWDCVLFILATPEHWLIQIDTTTIVVPRRAFRDRPAEQAFLDLAARRMRPEANDRSVLAKQ